MSRNEPVKSMRLNLQERKKSMCEVPELVREYLNEIYCLRLKRMRGLTREAKDEVGDHTTPYRLG